MARDLTHMRFSNVIRTGLIALTAAGLIVGAANLAYPGPRVSSTDDVPSACFAITVNRALSITADASCSRGAGRLTYSWAWGDGASSDVGPQASHSYAVCPSATFEVLLSVRDDTGLSSQTSRSVRVQDRDRDGDRLHACLEVLQGTSDRKADFDSDGINDLVESRWWSRADEVFCGRRCALPHPLQRDVYVEVDRMATPVGHSHSHRIPRSVVARLVDEFGAHGIRLHVDQGTFGGGETLPHDAAFSWDGSKNDDADRYYNNERRRGFTQARRGIFRYAVVAHALAGDHSCRIAGLGEAPTGHEKRYGDFIVVFRACLDGLSDESAELAHVFLQELGHNLFGLIQPERDRFPCPRSSGVDPWHDRFYGYAMWPYVGGGGWTYHPRRWQEDMNDMGKSIRRKLGARYHVNKMFLPGPAPCS